METNWKNTYTSTGQQTQSSSLKSLLVAAQVKPNWDCLHFAKRQVTCQNWGKDGRTEPERGGEAEIGSNDIQSGNARLPPASLGVVVHCSTLGETSAGLATVAQPRPPRAKKRVNTRPAERSPGGRIALRHLPSVVFMPVAVTGRLNNRRSCRLVGKAKSVSTTQQVRNDDMPFSPSVRQHDKVQNQQQLQTSRSLSFLFFSFSSYELQITCNLTSMPCIMVDD